MALVWRTRMLDLFAVGIVLARTIEC
jgi:hypothetical protein